VGNRANLRLAFSVVLLASCSPTTDVAKQTPTPAALVSLAASPVLSRLAAPPPASCPPGPKPQNVSPDFGPGLGQAPVWAVSFNSGAHGAILLVQGTTTRGEHGFYQKVLWVIQHGYSHVVQLRGSDLASRSPLWFQIGDSPPTTTPALDPAHPGADPFNPANPDQMFPNYPSYLFIPHAGCYVLEASWPEGHWRIPFAAGGG